MENIIFKVSATLAMKVLGSGMINSLRVIFPTPMVLVDFIFLIQLAYEEVQAGILEYLLTVAIDVSLVDQFFH